MSTKIVHCVDGTLPHRPRATLSIWRKWHIVVLLIAVGFLSMPVFALPARADHVQPVPSADPSTVVENYATAVNAGDLKGILNLYADDAVHIALPSTEGSGICLGKEQFRVFYEQSVANGDRIEVDKNTLEVDGDRVTFVAHLASDPWRNLGIKTLDADVEAVVKDGRFATHVVMLTPRSVRELLTALGTIPIPPAGGEIEADQISHGPH